MDELDKQLLNLIQTEVPVGVRPWAALGVKLGCSEAEIMQRVNALKTGRAIRQISAIFDTQSLGYESSLEACQCDPHRYTLAVAPTSRLGLAGTLAILHRQTGALSTRPLPTLHLFKIGVELDVAGTGKAGDKGAVRYDHTQRQVPVPLTDLEIQYVRAMQQDLPVEPEPFVTIAGQLGISLAELQQLTAGMIAAGRLRRFSAVLRHRELGFSANGMGIWAVPEADVQRVGRQMAAYRAVTHCYRRPTYPDWPYNIFTMIHARSRDECQAVVEQLAHATGVTEHGVLFSTKEYKKVRVQYFAAAAADWEAQHCENRAV